jgi:hypothetical protein
MEEEEMEEESCSPLRIPRYAQLLPILERKVRLWCNPRLPAQRSMSFSSREQIKDTLSGTQISDLYVVLPIALSQQSHPIAIESINSSESLPSQLANSQSRYCPRESTQLSQLCATESIEIRKIESPRMLLSSSTYSTNPPTSPPPLKNHKREKKSVPVTYTKKVDHDHATEKCIPRTTQTLILISNQYSQLMLQRMPQLDGRSANNRNRLDFDTRESGSVDTFFNQA